MDQGSVVDIAPRAREYASSRIRLLGAHALLRCHENSDSVSDFRIEICLQFLGLVRGEAVLIVAFPVFPVGVPSGLMDSPPEHSSDGVLRIFVSGLIAVMKTTCA